MVYMMMKIVNDEHFKNNNIKLMYDICCQLDKHLRVLFGGIITA